MPHSPEEKKRVLTRVRRIKGQLEALERALDAGAECAPVLQQIAAVRGAVPNPLRGERPQRHPARADGHPAHRSEGPRQDGQRQDGPRREGQRPAGQRPGGQRPGDGYRGNGRRRSGGGGGRPSA